MLELYSIGHSNRALEDFISMLWANQISAIADVRTRPQSRFNPHFNRVALSESLELAGITYRHFPDLGGLRSPAQTSRNTGWQNPAFRAFADYMQSPDFTAGLAQLILWTADERIAILCAEADPLHCHRSLIADALFVRGITVRHILSETALRPHTLTPFAQANGLVIIYPPTSDVLPL